MPAKRTLTDQAAQRLKPRAGEIQTDYFDQSYPGLALRVSARRRVWCYLYRLHGRQHRLVFDLYPAMSVAAAHDAWRLARDEVRAGRDPSHKVETPSERFGDVLEDWLRKDQAANKSLARIEQLVRRNIPPAWLHRQIRDIRRRDCLDAVDAVADRGAVVTARRFQARLHRLFAWAVGRGIVDVNPLTGVDKPGQETSRSRVLADEELVQVWRTAAAIGHPYAAAYQLLILTGARREEIGGLRWSEIEDGQICLSGARTKNGQARVIPLSTPARALLQRLERIGGTDYVFGKPLRSWDGAKAKLDKHAALAEPWVVHDLRRTVATGLQKIGTPLVITESVLGHTAGSRSGIVSVYQRHDYAAEKAAALEAWGSYVTGLVEGRAPGKVVPMRGAR